MMTRSGHEVEVERADDSWLLRFDAERVEEWDLDDLTTRLAGLGLSDEAIVGMINQFLDDSGTLN
jgi:hypothetical protein